MNNLRIRIRSLKYLAENGVEINLHLPLLESINNLRNLEEIVNRSLALSAVVACSFGFDKKMASDWLKDESVYKFLTQTEVSYLNTSNFKNEQLQVGVEALHAFAWMLGKVENFSPFLLCEESLVSIFPNLKQQESSKKYKESVKPREVEDVIEQLDLLYCMHSAIIDNTLNSKEISNLTQLYVIEQRRMVLEWAISDKKWEEINLDT